MQFKCMCQCCLIVQDTDAQTHPPLPHPRPTGWQHIAFLVKAHGRKVNLKLFRADGEEACPTSNCSKVMIKVKVFCHRQTD